MAQNKYEFLDLTGLQEFKELFQGQIDVELAKSFKSAKFDETTRALSLFKAETPAGDADFTVTIPKTDVSGLMEKLTTANTGNVVITKADGTVEDGGVALADLATKTEVKVVNDKVSANETAIKENTEAISLLNDGSTVEGSVDYKIAQAVAAIMENPDETMNSINELVTWCNDHAKDALELSNKVSANTADIDALEKLVGETGVAQQIASAIASALKIEGVDKYALATDLTASIARIATLESTVHEHENKKVLDGITAEKVSAWDSAEQNAKAYADGLGVKYDSAGSAKAAETNSKTYAKEYADGLNTTMDTKVEDVSDRITELETKVGEGVTAITIEEINALFAQLSSRKEVYVLNNNDYFELRQLTEQIFQIREFIMKHISPDSEEYEKIVNLYNQLCIEREKIEKEYGLIDQYQNWGFMEINKATKHINIGDFIPVFVFSKPWCNLYHDKSLTVLALLSFYS